MSRNTLTKWNGFQPVAGTGEGDDAVDEGREEGAVAMLKEERAARSAWKGLGFQQQQKMVT